MTRVQKERFFNEADYIRLKDKCILTTEKMELAKPDLCVMHPLPRVNEIVTAINLIRDELKNLDNSREDRKEWRRKWVVKTFQ